MRASLALVGVLLCLLCTERFSAEGYEQDVHLTLTKYLAQWAGFSESEAAEIAKANQELDSNPAFSAMPDTATCTRLFGNECIGTALGAINEKLLNDWVAKWKNDPSYQRMISAQRAYHFPDQKRLSELRGSAFTGKNLKTLGHYLHALQDSFSHSLMDYPSLASLRDFDFDRLLPSVGALPDSKILGHILYGHSVDKTWDRPDLAELMARYVYRELVQYKRSANRYAEIEATVARFVRETDSPRRIAFLTKLPSSEKPLRTAGAITGAPELTFRMKDGSTVSGPLQEDSIKLKSSVGLATVPVKDIVSFGDGEVRLKDGSVLKGEPASPTLTVASKYGRLELKSKDIVWFGVGTPPSAAAPATPPTSLPAPAVGAAGSSVLSVGGSLPQNYGVFVSSGGRLYELREDLAEKENYVVTYEKMRWYPACCENQQIVKVPPSVSIDFIVHLRGLSNAQMSLYQFYFVRKLLFINWTILITPQQKKEIRSPNTWIALQEWSDLVQSPIQGQPEMMRIRPRHDLQAGIYGLRIQAGTVRYPAKGFLVFSVGDDLGATETYCRDWKLEAGAEGSDSLNGSMYACFADAFKAIQIEQPARRDQSGQQVSVPSERRPDGTQKPGASEIIRQINQEEKARIARYPAENQRRIVQRAQDGREAMKRKDWKRARSEYDGIILKYDPQNFEAHVNLSGIHAMLNEVDSAKKHFDIASRRAPSFAIPYVNMVYAYARAGNTEEAVKYLEKVVEVGYGDLAKLRTDPDLPESFRENARVQQLTSKGG